MPHVISHPLTRKCFLSSDSDRLEQQLEEAVTLRQDYESSSSKLKALDKQVKALRQEKEDIHKVGSSHAQHLQAVLWKNRVVLHSEVGC